MTSEFVFTSESVTGGHPDKLCDQIADAIMGRYLRQDRMASVIAEAAISTGIIFVAARVGSDSNIDVPRTAREIIQQAGYDRGGFDVRNCTVMTNITDVHSTAGPEESELDDDQIDRVAVSDQAVVFGFACDHTSMLMPLPIRLAHKLAQRICTARNEQLPFLAPDAKTQVGVEFRDRRPRRIHSISIVAKGKRAGRAPSSSKKR